MGQGRLEEGSGRAQQDGAQHSEPRTLPELIDWVERSIQANEQAAYAAQGAAMAMRAVLEHLRRITADSG